MPTYRNISISLQSQYDALTIPEHALPSARVRPPSSLLVPGGGHLDCFSVAEGIVDISDANRGVAEVGIPVYPCSQFWISYGCVPPFIDSECRYYYFKLYANGKCIVSWDVGEPDDWSGKVMFGLFDGGTDFEGRRVVEKRGFLFLTEKENAVDRVGGSFEIRVFRSKARRREKAVTEAFHEANFRGSGLNIPNVGRLRKGEPRRRYAHALIDPTDEPYCTFKYHLRPSSSTRGPSESPVSSVDLASILQGEPEECEEAYVTKRLSVPPRMRLHPSTTHAEPCSPIKKLDKHDSSGGMLSEQNVGKGAQHNAHATRNERDSANRTPSPGTAGRGRFDRAGTPPSVRSKNGSVSLLRGVIANALKRRDGSPRGDSLA